LHENSVKASGNCLRSPEAAFFDPQNAYSKTI